MKVVSVNVGLPRTVVWQGQYVSTGIFKDPVEGPVPVRTLNLDGDRQADLTVHGGPDKAIYAYPGDHYLGWKKQLGRSLSAGAFGENLTTQGLLEADAHIGDEYRVGTARLVVTQPRMPCFKLGLRFGDPGMVKTFLKSGWPGIYFKVLEEGTVKAGDEIERLVADERKVSVTEMLRLILDHQAPEDEVRRVLEIPHLAEVWREGFKDRLGI